MKTSLQQEIKRTRKPRMPYTKPELVYRGLHISKHKIFDSQFSAATLDFISHSCVVRDDQADTLEISLLNMAIYELYLFALGLPATFPTEQVLIYSKCPNRYMPMHADRNSNAWKELYLHCYQLTLPAHTEREEYRQRIINDINAQFGLDAQLQSEQTVKGIPQNYTENDQDLRITWQQRLVLVIKEVGG